MRLHHEKEGGPHIGYSSDSSLRSAPQARESPQKLKIRRLSRPTEPKELDLSPTFPSSPVVRVPASQGTRLRPRRPTLPGAQPRPRLYINPAQHGSPPPIENHPIFRHSQENRRSVDILNFPLPPTFSSYSPPAQDDSPTEQKVRRRPNRLEKIVSESSVPRTSHPEPGTPTTPSTPSFPKLHKRPTLMDIVKEMEEQRERSRAEALTQLENLPPVPPIPPGLGSRSRGSSGGSDVSSIISGKLSISSDRRSSKGSYNSTSAYGSIPPAGNAFSPRGFWGSGSDARRFQPKPEDIERYKRTLKKCTNSDGQESSTSSDSEDETPSKKASIGSSAKRVSTDTDLRRISSGSGQKNSSFSSGLKSSHGSNRLSNESDPSSSEQSFSAENFLKSLGRVVSVGYDTAHPFPKFETPNDGACREAYQQVRKLLIAFWHSKVAPRESWETQISEMGNSVASLPLSSAPESSKQPSLRIKPSQWLKFGRKESEEDIESPAEKERDVSGSPFAISAMPKLPKSKKKKEKKLKDDENDDEGFGPPEKDYTTERVWEITTTVLWQLQEDFNDRKLCNLSTYVTAKATTIPAMLADFDDIEVQAAKQYTITSRKHMENPDSWQYIKDPKAHEDPNYLENASKYEFETVLDQQSQSLFMMRERRKRKEICVPAAGYRLIWATKFADWAANKWEDYLVEYQLAKEKAFEEYKKAKRNGLGTEVTAGSTSSRKSKRRPGLRIRTSSEESSNEEQAYPGVLSSKRPEEKGKDKEFPFLPVDTLNFEELDLDSPIFTTQPSPTLEGESPKHVRMRRRKTTFNTTMMTPPIPDQSLAIPIKTINAATDDNGDWEEELRRGLEAEKERQEKERKRRRDLESIRKDPGDDEFYGQY